jgi:hypothetical protein
MTARNVPCGHYSVTVSTAQDLATLIGAAVPSAASWVLINPANEIRYRDDRTAPTNIVGVKIPSDAIYMYDGSLDLIQLCSVVGSTVVQLSFYAGSPNR